LWSSPKKKDARLSLSGILIILQRTFLIQYGMFFSADYQKPILSLGGIITDFRGVSRVKAFSETRHRKVYTPDNASEYTAKAVRKWLSDLGIGTLFIEPGSPWENGYAESFIGKFRDELLNGEIFDTLLEARVLLERWRRGYNWLSVS